MTLISNRKRKLIDHDYKDNEEYTMTTRKLYKTRSMRRTTALKVKEEFAIHSELFSGLPMELKSIIAGYSFKSAYLLEIKELLSSKRPIPLKMSIMLFRRYTRSLQLMLTFYYENNNWVIEIEEEDDVKTVLYQDLQSFSNELLNILLKNYLLVSNDAVHVRFKYTFDFYRTLQPFKLLKYDPKFDAMDIYNLVYLYLNTVDTLELCLSDGKDYYMYKFEEKSGFGQFEYQWIIAHSICNNILVYKILKVKEQMYYIVEYGNYDQIKDFVFFKVNGTTGKPNHTELNYKEAIETLKSLYMK